MSVDHPDRERLLGYVDNVLDSEERARVQALIENDEQAAAFVDALRETELPFAQVMQPLLEHKVPASVEKLIQDAKLKDKKQSGVAHYAIAASLIAGVAVGALLMSLFGSRFGLNGAQTAPDWVRQVAIYHKLYTRPTLANAKVPEAGSIQKLVSNTLGKDIGVPDLSNFDVEFKRGQPLQVNDKPLLQLAYLPSKGTPLALCILRDAGLNDSDIDYGEVEGLPYSYWAKDGLGYMLVGEIEPQALARISESVRQQLL